MSSSTFTSDLRAFFSEELEHEARHPEIN